MQAEGSGGAVGKNEAEQLVAALRELQGVIQKIGLYDGGHPAVRQGISRCYHAIGGLLASHAEITLAFARREVLWQDTTLGDRDVLMRALARHMYARTILALTFKRGLKEEELRFFLEAVVQSPETLHPRGGVSRMLDGAGISRVLVQEIDTRELLERGQLELSSLAHVRGLSEATLQKLLGSWLDREEGGEDLLVQVARGQQGPGLPALREHLRRVLGSEQSDANRGVQLARLYESARPTADAEGQRHAAIELARAAFHAGPRVCREVVRSKATRVLEQGEPDPAFAAAFSDGMVVELVCDAVLDPSEEAAEIVKLARVLRPDHFARQSLFPAIEAVLVERGARAGQPRVDVWLDARQRLIAGAAASEERFADTLDRGSLNTLRELTQRGRAPDLERLAPLARTLEAKELLPVQQHVVITLLNSAAPADRLDALEAAISVARNLRRSVGLLALFPIASQLVRMTEGRAKNPRDADAAERTLEAIFPRETIADLIQEVIARQPGWETSTETLRLLARRVRPVLVDLVCDPHANPMRSLAIADTGLAHRLISPEDLVRVIPRVNRPGVKGVCGILARGPLAPKVAAFLAAARHRDLGARQVALDTLGPLPDVQVIDALRALIRAPLDGVANAESRRDELMEPAFALRLAALRALAATGKAEAAPVLGDVAENAPDLVKDRESQEQLRTQSLELLAGMTSLVARDILDNLAMDGGRKVRKAAAEVIAKRKLAAKAAAEAEANEAAER